MNYTAIFYAFIGLLLTAITGVLIPYVKARIGEVNYNRVVVWITAAVHAVEEVIKQSGQGAAKKRKVLEDVSAILHTYKIEVTPEEIDNIIEDAVKKMNDAAKLEANK